MNKNEVAALTRLMYAMGTFRAVCVAVVIGGILAYVAGRDGVFVLIAGPFLLCGAVRICDIALIVTARIIGFLINPDFRREILSEDNRDGQKP